MTITYPLAASALWEQLRFAGRPEFVLQHFRKQSQDGAGNTLSASLGTPKWSVAVVLEGGRHNRNLTQESDIKHLEGRDGTFLAYDIRRPWPAVDPGGVKLDRGSLIDLGEVAASGNTVTGAYSVEGVATNLATAVGGTSAAGTYFDSYGVLQLTAADTVRLNYGPFDNFIGNPRASGAVAGSPGTMPTRWGSNNGGLTRTVVGSGIENGIDYVDIRLSGTTASTFALIEFENTSAVVASAGQVWSQAVFCAIVDGDLTNVTNVQTVLREVGAGGSATANMALSAVLSRQPAATRTMGSGVTNAWPTLTLLFASGVLVNITLRIGFPTLELAASASTYPRVPLGVLAEKATTNKVTCRKHNPTDTSNLAKWGDVASTLSIVSDTGALLASGLAPVCTNGNVYRLDNSAGVAPAGVTIGGTHGNTNAHSVQAFVRGGTGGVGNSGTPARTTFAASSIYRLIQALNFVPGSSSHQMEIQVNAGQVVYFILPQMEEATTLSLPVVGTTLAAVARAADALAFHAVGRNDWTITADNNATQAFNDDPGDFTPTASALTRPHIKAWSAVRDQQPSASVVQVKSKGSNNRSLALKGLPPFFTVTKSDKLSILYSSTKRFLFEAMETVTADINGEMAEFEIQPFLPSGTAVNDAVTLKKAPAKFKVVAGSYRPSAGRGNISDGVAFAITSVP